MIRCPYRADKECKHIGAEDPDCYFCLMGQQADEISLLTREIMNFSINKLEKEAEASIEERLCMEEQK